MIRSPSHARNVNRCRQHGAPSAGRARTVHVIDWVGSAMGPTPRSGSAADWVQNIRRASKVGYPRGSRPPLLPGGSHGRTPESQVRPIELNNSVQARAR